jgi:hypothetical protein
MKGRLEILRYNSTTRRTEKIKMPYLIELGIIKSISESIRTAIPVPIIMPIEGTLVVNPLLNMIRSFF